MYIKRRINKSECESWLKSDMRCKTCSLKETKRPSELCCIQQVTKSIKYHDSSPESTVTTEWNSVNWLDIVHIYAEPRKLHFYCLYCDVNWHICCWIYYMLGYCNEEIANVKEIVWYFGKYSFSLACWGWDEKIDTSHSYKINMKLQTIAISLA